MSTLKLVENWEQALWKECEKPYFRTLSHYIKDEILVGKTIYPHPGNIFAALDATPFDRVKVIILWQDPYHGPGQAHGLAFSVPEWVKIPPSLRNIFREIKNEIALGLLPPSWRGMNIWVESRGILNQINPPSSQSSNNSDAKSSASFVGTSFTKGGSGNLTHWAAQWVLLLNTTLTVRADEPMSHAGKWWEVFTDSVIRTLSGKREFLIFLLWWSHAQKKKSLIDTSKHIILEAPHPSPLSAHRGFLGCGHFSKTNQTQLQDSWATVRKRHGTDCQGDTKFISRTNQWVRH